MRSERRVKIYDQVELVITWDPDNTGGSPGSAQGAETMLGGLQANFGRSPRPLIERWGAQMRKSYRINFQSAGRPVGWKSLAPSTVAHKQAGFRSGRLPPRTPTGRIPRRLLQVNRATGARELSPFSILIESGRLRDSWCVKGARGNVTDVTDESGQFGSQLTVERDLLPTQMVKHYHILTQKAQAARKRGQTVTAKVPLARIHEEGAPRANIPPRPVAHTGSGEANVQPDDWDQIKTDTLAWAMGVF